MAILMIGKRRWPMRKSCCSGMPSSQRWADRCPPKAKLTRSNRVRCAGFAAAGRRMGMSYKRAWYLIDTMNAYFSEPVVVSAKFPI
jgi:hypothetical protein